MDFFETTAIMKAAYIEQPSPADSIHYGELPWASVPVCSPDQCLAGLAAGKLKATIHCTLHLSQAAEAHRMQAHGGLLGKIVLIPDE